MDTTQVVEIDLLQLLKKLWYRKFQIILVSLFSASVALSLSLFVLDPIYTSTTKIYVVNQKAGQETLTAQDFQTGNFLVKDYKEIIVSKDVLSNVIARENLAVKEGGLLSKISVSIPTDTRIISISVRDGNPEEAARLANAVREVAAEKIKAVTNVEKINTIEEAEPSERPSSPRVQRNTILGFLAGGFLAVVSVLLAEVLDDRVKRPEDIEEVLGMTLLGIVPDIDQLK